MASTSMNLEDLQPVAQDKPCMIPLLVILEELSSWRQKEQWSPTAGGERDLRGWSVVRAGVARRVWRWVTQQREST